MTSQHHLTESVPQQLVMPASAPWPVCDRSLTEGISFIFRSLINSQRVLLPGSGVGPTVAIGEELSLVVNAKGAGKGKVSCVVVQPDGTEVEAEVLENEDGTFDIFYTAPAPGNYVIYVRFGGENIPRSPFKVTVRRERILDKHFESRCHGHPEYQTCPCTLINLILVWLFVLFLWFSCSLYWAFHRLSLFVWEGSFSPQSHVTVEEILFELMRISVLTKQLSLGCTDR